MVLFGIVHLGYLVIGLGIVVPLSIWLAKTHGWDKKVFLISGLVLAPLELVRTLMLVEQGANGGYYLSPKYIPVHLCNLSIFFMFGIYFAKSDRANRWWTAIMAPTLICGAGMALLIPAPEGTDSFGSFLGVQFFVSHLVLVFAGIYMYIAKPYKFGWRTYRDVVIFMSLSFVGALYLNSILGRSDNDVNFWFVAYPPIEGLPLLNLDYGWGGYILNLAVLALVLISLTYVPVIVAHYRRAKAAVELVDESEDISMVA
jgi:uncharacterized membrane protein YwaF